MSSTSANEFSSRSHAILQAWLSLQVMICMHCYAHVTFLQLNYHRKHRFSETQRREVVPHARLVLCANIAPPQVSSTLSLVDLAGSERASQVRMST